MKEVVNIYKTKPNQTKPNNMTTMKSCNGTEHKQKLNRNLFTRRKPFAVLFWDRQTDTTEC